jgi:hypothetical protein
MSDSHLPEDIDRWPTDPFELLGLTFGASTADVRRAYTRLIRIFKPEHAPEEFRRIRDAYETATQWTKWRQRSGEAEPNADGDPAAQSRSPDGSELTDHILPDGPRPTDQPTEGNGGEHPDAAWRQALAGDLPTAYKFFLRPQQRCGSNDEPFLRLYWLLRVSPQLDTQRQPCDWLATGLRHAGLRGRLLELYLAAIELAPEEAATPRCQRLLDEATGSDRLVDFLDGRWRALGRLERWDLLGADLAAVREKLAGDPETWANLMLRAIDTLAWADTFEARELRDQSRRELEQSAGGNFAMHHALDQCEFLLETAQAFAETLPYLNAEIGARLHDLLRYRAGQPSEMVRLRLLEFLAPLIEDPSHGLAVLDDLRSRASPLLHSLGTLIDSVGGADSATPDDAVLWRHLTRVSPWQRLGSYGKLRLEIVSLSADYDLDLPGFIAFLNRSADNSNCAALVQRLHGDTQLHYLVKATRLYCGQDGPGD